MVNKTSIPTRPGIWLALACLCLFALPTFAAKIEVSLDRNPVAQNETFTLVFSAAETPDDDPDFGPLEQDFEVLGQTQSNQFSLDNGHANRRVEWQVTVMAKRAGTLEVPPIAFGSDQSPPLAVTVTPGAATGHHAKGDEDIFLEVETEPKKPYVQAQVIYTVRVLGRVRFNGELSNPEADDALIEKLADDRNYAVNRDGAQYNVFERRFALFPQKSGPLKIGPVHLTAQVAGGGGSPFNPFFGRQPQTRRIDSEAVNLDVRPIPKEFTGKHWLPAENLTLEDSWAAKPPRIALGEPATRTLTLKAQGATVGVLPELNPDAASTTDFKQYPDQPAINETQHRDGVSSSRQEKTALMVSRPGTYRLPAVEIPWWNTRADRLETARIPERVLTVAPAPGTAPTPETTPAPAAPQAEPATATPAPGASVPVAPMAPTVDLGFWLAWLFGAGWLATAVAWGISARRPTVSPAPRPAPDPAPSQRQMVEAIERACRANDAMAARRALAAWAERRWPGLGAADWARRCGGELGREIGRLDRGLYGREPGADWRGDGLWRGFQAYMSETKAGAETRALPTLEPLYKR